MIRTLVCNKIADYSDEIFFIIDLTPGFNGLRAYRLQLHFFAFIDIFHIFYIW